MLVLAVVLTCLAPARAKLNSLSTSNTVFTVKCFGFRDVYEMVLFFRLSSAG